MHAHAKARGIGVCEDWATFARFLEHIGERPAGTQLRRLDTDRPFELGNAAWMPRPTGDPRGGRRSRKSAHRETAAASHPRKKFRHKKSPQLQ
jgi:hypothetical protein